MIYKRNTLISLLMSLLFGACLFISITASATQLPQDDHQYEENLLDRIRNGFSLALPTNSKAIRKIETPFTRRPETLNRIIQNSERYLYYIVEEVERRGMPMEIALIPVIEVHMIP